MSAVSSSERAVDAVVLDYGGVLTGPVRRSLAAWLEADGVEPASLTRVLTAWLSRDAPRGTPIHRLETGELAPADFEEQLAAELSTVDGRAVDPAGLLGRIFAGLEAEPAMFALAEELRELGVRVALLSNSWGNTYRRDRIDGLFDPVVISGEVGLRKPEASIYQLVLDGLGVAPERTLFVDDAEPNVVGARALGMRGIVHADPASTRAAVAELIPF